MNEFMYIAKTYKIFRDFVLTFYMFVDELKVSLIKRTSNIIVFQPLRMDIRRISIFYNPSPISITLTLPYTIF